MAEQSVPDTCPIQPGDEVSFELTMSRLPSMSQRVIGKVSAVRSDGLVTAEFPQEGASPMLITDRAESFVRIRTTPDVAAAFAAGRAQAAADIRAADTDGWPGGRQSEVDGCQEAAARIAEGPS